MSYESSKQDAERKLRKWDRANETPAAQTRLIGDPERLWRLARDLARTLDSLLSEARAEDARQPARATRSL